mgnify:CR=1 FL=1
MNLLPWLKNPRKIFTASRIERKGCGCKVFVPAGYEGLREKNWPNTELLEEERIEEEIGRYHNCTKYREYETFRLKCTECDTVYRTRRRAGSRTAYGEKNPEASVKLEEKLQRAPLVGGRVISNEKPVIENGADEEE